MNLTALQQGKANKVLAQRFNYSGIGILSAIIYHGLWNYNLSSSGQAAYSIMILMLVMGLVVAKFASDDLTTKYRRKLRNV